MPPKKKAEKTTKEEVKKKPIKKAVASKEVKPQKKEEEVVEVAKIEVAEEPVVKSEIQAKLTPAVRKYFYAVGRRKESYAHVQLLTRGSSQITVNGKPLDQYFPTGEWSEKVLSPLVAVGQLKNLDVQAKVKGGGLTGQAEAVRHAIARALLKLNPVFRKSLRRNSFLTRDPRMKERKKYGLKKARRAPQWSKR